MPERGAAGTSLQSHTWLCVVAGEAALDRFVAGIRLAWARGEQVSFDRITFRPDGYVFDAKRGEK